MGTDSHTFVGNGKKVDMPTNSGVLKVVGNNCFVCVKKNEGQIIITGNKGHLQVTQNTGNICYTGNNGLIEVGKTSVGIGQVVYTGNGGIVKRMKTSDNSEKSNTTKSSKLPKEPKMEEEQKPKKKVESELRVNGVEVSMKTKSSKSVGKENSGHEKLKRSGTAPTVTKKVVLQNKSGKGESKSARRVSLVRTSNIQLLNVNDFHLENWCLGLATELVHL